MYIPSSLEKSSAGKRLLCQETNKRHPPGVEKIGNCYSHVLQIEMKSYGFKPVQHTTFPREEGVTGVNNRHSLLDSRELFKRMKKRSVDELRQVLVAMTRALSLVSFFFQVTQLVFIILLTSVCNAAPSGCLCLLTL